jgi:hypothetical protein
MQSTFRTPRLLAAALCWTLVTATFLAVGVSWSQTALIGADGDGDSDAVVPTTCPLYLRGGLPGWLFGIPHAGHRWTAAWDRGEVLSADYDRARYHPQSYDGYESYNKGDYIDAYYSDARWYKPQMDVKCTAVDHYFAGRWIGRDESYDPYRYYGTVEDCTGSGSGRGGTQLVDDPEYDIYSPEDGSDSCTETPGEGGGDESGSGTQYQPGDSTGGKTVDWGTGQGNGGTSKCGATAVVEYVCIDVWTESGWQEWDCGYVTSC